MGEYIYEIKDPKSPASPKQKAFLTYLKQKYPRNLTKGQAGQIIDSFRCNADVRADWKSTRRVLFPDLYYEEDVSLLYSVLYDYIRSTMRGGSQKLTRKKIEAVINTLDKTQRGWDAVPNFQSIFRDKLNDLYPDCCDEKGQTRERRDSTVKRTRNTVKQKAKGCLWIILAQGFIVVLLIFFILQI